MAILTIFYYKKRSPSGARSFSLSNKIAKRVTFANIASLNFHNSVSEEKRCCNNPNITRTAFSSSQRPERVDLLRESRRIVSKFKEKKLPPSPSMLSVSLRYHSSTSLNELHSFVDFLSLSFSFSLVFTSFFIRTLFPSGRS